MEAKEQKLAFRSAMKYAFGVRFGAPHSIDGVPNVGIVFGSPELATKCQEYISKTYENDQLIIEIAQSTATAEVRLKELNGNNTVFTIELNYDSAELRLFQEKVSPTSRVALLFGFKRNCDYYVTGNSNDKPENFSPIVLAAIRIQ